MMFRAPHFKQPDFLKIMHLCGCTGLRKGSYTAAVCHAGRIYRTFISSPHGLFFNIAYVDGLLRHYKMTELN